MKRTFGRSISLLLVLAMVLAMVPAVLAADTNITETSAAPGELLTLTLPDSVASASTYYWKAGGSSNYLTVPYSTTTKSNTVTVSKNITQATDNLYVYAYSTAAAADKNIGLGYSYSTSADKAIWAFRIKVTPWKISLAVDTNVTTGFNNTLNPNGTVTLRATVTGPANQLTSKSVVFTIGGNEGVASLEASSPAMTKSVQLTATSSTTAIASATVKGGSLTGQIYVTASVTPSDAGNTTVTARYPASESSYIEVRSDASYSLTLAEQNIYVTKGGTIKYIQPTLKRNNVAVSGASYTYSFVGGTNDASGSGKNIVVNPNGSIYPQVEETTAPVQVQVTESTTGLSAVCYVSVIKNAATITGLAVSESTDLTAKRFAKLPTLSPGNYKTFVEGLMTETVLLEATVVSEDENAANRLVWTSSNTKIATVAGSTDGSGNATVTAVAPGKVTITATMPSTSGSSTTKTVDLYVWTPKTYASIEKPTLASSINDPYTTCTELAKQPLKATLSTGRNQTVNLTASYEYTYDNSARSYTFTGTVNAFDETNRIVYYPAPTCTGLNTTTYKIDVGSATISSVQLVGPVDASFKVNEKLGNLTCTIRTTDPTETISSIVWRDKNNNEVQTESVANAKLKNGLTYYTSTLSLTSKITSPGDYQYYCEVTTTKPSPATGTTVRSGIANVVVGGDYIISIDGLPTSVRVGDTLTFTAKPQQYINGKYTDVTASGYTIAWSVSDANVGTLNKTTGSSVSFTVKGGGKVTVTAETTIASNKYTGTKEFTVTIPTADTVRLTLGENDSYVLLKGDELADAVKTASKTTPSSFLFKSPSNGTLYTSSALSTTVSTSTRYTSSEVSRMAYRPARATGTHEIEYTAYDGSAQIATGKLLVMTSANTVEYHISANETQQLLVSDFQSVYGTGLSSVVFGSNTDTRGGLYKGSTTGSGKVGSESYSVSSGTNLLKNLYFIAGSTTSKYSVTIPFTASGTAGSVSGQLVVYVNDTHTLNVTGATFRSMGIATELAPDNANGSTYITIDRVVGGKLYSSYTSIKSCTALTSKDLGSTKFYFTGTNSLDNLYVLPLADSKSVDITYTIDGSTKGTLSFKVNQQTSSNQFTDVTGNYKWAANSVDFMFMNDIIKGNSTKNPKIFGPGAKMTRAMLVTVLYRAAGEPTVAGITNKFTDNKQGQYYYNAVLWASSLGIVNGATATTFDPDGNITREQIAAILYRYAGSPTVTGSLSGYADQAQVSPFAVTAMQWAVGSGIITGTPNGGKTYLTAKGNATRAQVAVMLHRFLTFD